MSIPLNKYKKKARVELLIPKIKLKLPGIKFQRFKRLRKIKNLILLEMNSKDHQYQFPDLHKLSTKDLEKKFTKIEMGCKDEKKKRQESERRAQIPRF